MSEKFLFNSCALISSVGKPKVPTTSEDMPVFLRDIVGKRVKIPPAIVKKDNYLQEQIDKTRKVSEFNIKN